ncbi:phosphoadenylyl-sulfate reductase [Microvirga flavescens]|uniref:phosphoadenylyl-sulfate reductase n=1 Tax=Microvirga flavescens TaxID=2249811 RepID=UPI000DD71AAB|nr:phosphoadenylyl-sulfate reductase [Microvirga flavescens]
MPSSVTLAEDLSSALQSAPLPRRLSEARARLDGPVVFTTSFGLEDQAITHAIFANDLDIHVVTLDTGRLFPETYDVWAATEEFFGRRIAALSPNRDVLEALIADQGINGFYRSIEARKACCQVRKVELLARALTGAAGWITGLRAGQSTNRRETPLAEADPAYALIKVNPLADWNASDAAQYVSDNRVPYNVLHDRGFPSIGCAPCTRAVRVGEPERAGRWWWENDAKKECGLHLHPSPQEAARLQEVL